MRFGITFLFFLGFVFAMQTMAELQEFVMVDHEVTYIKGVEKVHSLCRKKKFSSAIKAVELWLEQNRGSRYQEQMNCYRTNIGALAECWQKLLSSGQSVDGVTIKIENSTLTAKAIINDKVMLEENGQLRTLPLSVLSSKSLYLLLKKTVPANCRDNYMRLKASEGVNSSKLHAALSKRSNAELQKWFTYCYQATVLKSFLSKFQLVANNLDAGRLEEVDYGLKELAKGRRYYALVEAVYDSLMKQCSEKLKFLLEERERKETGRFANFPVKAGAAKRVKCLDYPSLQYDIYLPSSYDCDGEKLLPIVYTFSPGGGGLMKAFRKVGEELQIIVVGDLHYKNSTSSDQMMHSFYAVIADIRKRVKFDPTAQFSSGFSGGGWNAFSFSRYHSPHISGVFSMGGWLGRNLDRHKFLSGLIVSRGTGINDKGAKSYLDRDAEYVKKFGALVRDWEFKGGHSLSPDSVKKGALSWMLSQRTKVGKEDRQLATRLVVDWRKKVGMGQIDAALKLCYKTLMGKPRTHQALQAQLLMEKTFTRLNAENTSVKLDYDLLGLEYFLTTIHGAAILKDATVFNGALKCLLGMEGAISEAYGTVAWFLVMSDEADITNHQLALELTELCRKNKEFGKSANNKLTAAAVYAVTGDKSKAKELFDVSEDDVSRQRYAQVKKILL